MIQYISILHGFIEYSYQIRLYLFIYWIGLIIYHIFIIQTIINKNQIKIQSMLKRLNRPGPKIALFVCGLAGLTYIKYQSHKRYKEGQVQAQKISKEFTNKKIAPTTNHKQIFQDKGINKDQKDIGHKDKQQGEHHHDMDIRVLDMVGYPAVHGANILEPDHHDPTPQHNQGQHNKNNKTQHKQAEKQNKQQLKQDKPLEDDKQIQQNHSQNQNTMNKQDEPENRDTQKQNQNKGQHSQLIQTSQETQQQHHQGSQSQNIKQLPKQIKEQGVIRSKESSPIFQSKAKQLKKPKTSFTKISQIPQLNFSEQFDKDDYIVIVVDLPYNPPFEKQILTKLSNTVKRRFSNTPLKIYRANITDAKVKQHIQEKLGANVQQQTILFMKNPYEDKFINFDFDLYVKHNSLPSIYLSQLRVPQDKQQVQKLLTKMTPNDTYLLFVINNAIEGELAKKKLTAKYIQMEMGVNNIQNIKVLVLDEKLAKQTGIMQEAKPNSLHLLRKSNQFTFKTPNRKLFGDKPYLMIQNISLYDKTRNLMIPKYLSRIQTFNSMRVDAPFVCSLTIDRNKLSPKQQRQILGVFAKIKESQEFPNVSFVLRFGQTEYRGAKEQPYANKKWCLKLANLDQLDKQLFAHDVKKLDDIAALGITQQHWLRDTYQYLYREPQITKQGITSFITKCVNGQQPQFYKSQAKYKLQGVHKLTGDTFNQTIFEGDGKKSHLVFEYSDHCQACQVLSPVIQHFSYVCRKFPSIGTDVHSLNCDKNRVKGQQYSPYTPNLYFYSKNWKNRSPLRYPILQLISHTNVWGIYDFCTITDDLKKIDYEKFNEHIKNIADANIKITDF